MTISRLVVRALQEIPWLKVIRNAPMIADEAKHLWKSVSKKSSIQKLPDESTGLPLSVDAQDVATLQARLATMEVATIDLQNQMLASTELIKALADQNTQLIKRIRVVWLAGATVAFGIIIGLILIVDR